MHKLMSIAEKIRQDFDQRTTSRDQALAEARQLTRACSLAIRAVHRDDDSSMQEQLAEAHRLADALTRELKPHPDLYHAGYTQDALKEFVEANVTCALIKNQPLPTPEELGVPGATFLNGLAEVVGELRRKALDILRHGYSQEAERLLTIMDDIYSVLVTMDYPDAITNGLRRQTDLARRDHREDTRRHDLQPGRRTSGTGHAATERAVGRGPGRERCESRRPRGAGATPRKVKTRHECSSPRTQALSAADLHKDAGPMVASTPLNWAGYASPGLAVL